MIKKAFAILVFLTLFIQLAHSQENYEPVNFRLFTTKEGFHGDKVRSLLQDDHGFIWIGTNEGVFLYNGWKFEQFNETNKGINRVVNGINQNLFKDKTGDIWIGANTGLCHYQLHTGKLLLVNFPTSEEYFINSITQDSTGLIWVGTNKGIFSISKEGIAALRLDDKTFPEMNRIVFYSNRLWVISSNSICVFDAITSSLKDPVKFNSENNTTDNLQTAMTTDNSGNIWIGKYNGIIYKFNTYSKSISTLDIKKQTSNPAAIINHLRYDHVNNMVWVAIDEGGIFKINPTDNSIIPFFNDLNKSNGIPTLKITGILIDRERNVWFSMEKNGLAMTNKLLNSFSLINPLLFTSTSIVSAVLKDSKGNLWVGTDGGGLLKYGRDGKLMCNYKHDPGKTTSLSNDAILAITEDSKGRIWVGSFRGGLSLYNPKNNSFTNYLAEKSSANGLVRNDVRKIVEDQQGNLWLIVHGHGVTMFNPGTQVFTNYTNIASVWTYDLIIDHSGTIWVASNNGVSYFDKSNNTFTTIKSSQFNIDIHTLHEDRFGYLWIGTVKGLYFLDKKSKNLQQLPYETILNRISIKSIEETNDNKLIIATSKGLIIYNLINKEFSYFTSESGLPSEEFIVNSANNFKDSLIFLGTNKGLCYFKPSALMPFNLTHKPVITSILLFNKPIENSIKLPDAITGVSSLDLKHQQNNITIAFSYPHYINSTREFNYEYKMEGIDEFWKTSTDPVAVYPSLPAGNFRFKARIINKIYAQEASPEVIINIHVSPPFWDTLWFKLLIVFLVAFAVFYFYREKTNNILAANKELEEKVNERTNAISKQKEQLEKQRTELEQANQAKDKLFSIIAHDLRSPFSSILSITNLLQDKFEKISKEDLLKMIHLLRYSSENAFQLLDNLLEWAKSQTNSIKYNPEDISIVELCKSTISNYEKIAADKSIKFKFEPKADIIAFTDQEMLRTILRNLVNNAIKYTGFGGLVSVSTEIISDEMFYIKIQDTGKGMTKEQVDLILHDTNPLVSQQGTMGEKGTGLGLWICKEFLNHINGRFEINSEIDKGTLFTLIVTAKVSTSSYNDINNAKHEESSIATITKNLAPTTNTVKHQNKVVLIVEDQSDIMESLRLLLMDHFQLILAKNGAEAWDIIQDNYIDLILSDIVMPEMDGLSLSIKCKEQTQTNHIPIMLLTSQKEELDMIKGLQTGVDDYLIKPVNSEILLLKINHLLNNRDILKKKFSLENKELLDSISENSVDKQFMKKVLQLIDEHLQEESFGVEELSKHIGMHRSSLSKKLTSIAKISPNELIKIQRLKKAAQLLLASGLTVSEVAYDVGFSDPKYFSKSFKAYFSFLPSEYSRMKQGKT